MIQRMVTSALFAGFAAGLLAALLHFAFVQKLILLGEGYETGTMVHFGAPAPVSHGQDATATAAADAEHADDGHSHEPAAPAENRNAMTSLFFGLTYIAYALLLTAGFGLAQVYGKAIGLREGLLWGLAGFAAFQLAPAMGLAPELPGSMAADLTARQLWWLGTAVSTGLALAVLGYGKGALSLALAALLLALPHVIGAPHPEGFSGVAPPELAAAFATRSLGVGLIVWAALGALAGQFWSGKPL
ncbi:MAG: Cobalt transporter subunit CbtA [Rhodobacteraceae bacterium]|uniref:CbtA family protein n=1 Tax=Cypionkella sp. TaxID=2811411 RepID=UPI0013262542|nr:CbtA family protein [Cypionkella sp.]KAF0174382.1 MAG: Cobalt transporter subunit CbtA [Paracoccaceae bacterium]MDO8326571.1 CbtA family protein [Cypionkella sp.]